MPDFNSPLIHLEKFITLGGGTGGVDHILIIHILIDHFLIILILIVDFPTTSIWGDTVTYLFVAVRGDRKDVHVGVRGDSKDIYIVYVRSISVQAGVY